LEDRRLCAYTICIPIRAANRISGTSKCSGPRSAEGSKLSKRLPATGIIFRETQAEHDVDWHPAPRRQYIINLDAGVKITASDGETSFMNWPGRAFILIKIAENHRCQRGREAFLGDMRQNRVGEPAATAAWIRSCIPLFYS
jgi:hypothetical protein